MVTTKPFKPPLKSKRIDYLKEPKAAGVLACVVRTRVDRQEEISNEKGKMEKTTGLNTAIASSGDDLDADEDETTKTPKKGKVTITAHDAHDDGKDKVDKREMDYTIPNVVL